LRAFRKILLNCTNVMLLPSGKTVDPDIPILKEAKAEYAKLQ